MKNGLKPRNWIKRMCWPTVSVALAAVLVPVTMVMTQSAQAQGIQVSSATLNFGDQSVNTTSPTQVVHVTNNQTTPVTITSVQGAKVFSQWNNCITTLAPSASCSVRVLFSPTSAGPATGSVTITDNAANSPQKVALKGVGVLPALSLSPIEVVFATETVGSTSASQTITITNNNATALTITSLSLGGVASGDFLVPSTCNGALAGGASCAFDVTFTPTAGGVRVATLSVNNSAGAAQTVALTGTSVVGTVSLSATTLTFPSQQVLTTSAAQPVTITNSGASSMDIVSIIASGDFTQTNDCGATLAGGATCTSMVSFSPSAAGQRAGYLTVSDTGAGNLQTISLNGTAAAPVSTVAITPRVTSLTPSQSQQFQATVNGVVSADVNWLVDGVAEGTSNTGLISSSGLYSAPQIPGAHIITAQSQANTSQTASVPVTITNYNGTFTFHNDTFRTGQNVDETVLNTGNVNATQFGKRFSYALDGYTYAQPLYVENVTIPGQGTHNVVYVATEHDSVYALDADGLVADPLWKTSFIDPAAGVTTIPGSDVNMDGCEAIGPEVGITSTPVIDNVHGILYVLVRTKESGAFVQRLHALNITTGAEMPHSPAVITATAPGVGMGSQGNVLTLNLQYQNQRAALLLSNGIVYIAWASFCDYGPYHGWVLGYNATSLDKVSTWVTTPNGQRAGVWQSGGGLAADGSGNVYFATGNGTFDANGGGGDYGDSYVKLSYTSGSPAVVDYFTPYTQAILGGVLDLDLGSGGVLLLPNAVTKPQQLILGTGKDGVLYLVDRSNMGNFNPANNNQIVQSIPGAAAKGLWGNTAYWNMQVYIWGLGDVLKSFRLDRDLLSLAPVAEGSQVSAYPSPTPALSSNGNANGIVWAVKTALWKTGGSSILEAYDAANVSRLLYSSTTNATRDKAGPAVRFAIATVANGKVYVTTQTELDVYGLLP
jgi:Abnormal spindle-like microcephaly-assoc'd, ASPM-SPD-2-Hydin